MYSCQFFLIPSLIRIRVHTYAVSMFVHAIYVYMFIVIACMYVYMYIMSRTVMYYTYLLNTFYLATMTMYIYSQIRYLCLTLISTYPVQYWHSG